VPEEQADRQQAHAENLIPAELKAARNDFASARRSLEEDDDKWATIQAYYCVFHAARALLFAKGYREKSHFCLKAAIQVLYVDEDILDQEYVDDFDTTMLMRETADYKSDFSRRSLEMRKKRKSFPANQCLKLRKSRHDVVRVVTGHRQSRRRVT